MTLRIVSYNVRYFGHGTRGLMSTKGAMNRIAHAIARLSPLPDIVCLQEIETKSLRSRASHVGGEPQLMTFQHALAHALKEEGKARTFAALYFPAHVYGSLTSPIYTTGLAVLVSDRIQVLSDNSDDPHDVTHRGTSVFSRVKQTRICAHARLQAPNGSIFDVFNAHLSLPTIASRHFWNPERHMGSGANQLEEAKKIAAFVRGRKDGDRAVLVGDFNSLPGSPVYRFLSEELGFTDAYAHSLKADPEVLRGRPTAGFLNFRMRIDHVFSGRDLEWVSFDDTHDLSDRTGPFFGLSDHVPIVGSFKV